MHSPSAALVWSPCKSVRLMVDCKTVGFFRKISKEIGKAWRKSLRRAKRGSLTRPTVFSLVPGLV